VSADAAPALIARRAASASMCPENVSMAVVASSSSRIAKKTPLDQTRGIFVRGSTPLRGAGTRRWAHAIKGFVRFVTAAQKTPPFGQI
jgi:hypothetical protein